LYNNRCKQAFGAVLTQDYNNTQLQVAYASRESNKNTIIFDHTFMQDISQSKQTIGH